MWNILWMTARAVGPKAWGAESRKRCLCQNTSRRIAGTKKKDVVDGGGIQALTRTRIPGIQSLPGRAQ